MLLTISTTHRPATDLGFLLHKSPDTLHTFDLPFGQAHVFYPEASDERATAAFYLEVDAVGLVGDRGQSLDDASLLTVGLDPGDRTGRAEAHPLAGENRADAALVATPAGFCDQQ